MITPENPTYEIAHCRILVGKAIYNFGVCNIRCRTSSFLSSLVLSTWRGNTHARRTDGFERASALERYLFPIEAWIADSPADDAPDTLLFAKIHRLLGEKDGPQVFLASLLVSLLWSQQLAVKQRAEKKESCW